MRKKRLSLLFATIMICSSITTLRAFQAEKVEFELTEKFELSEPKVDLYITNQEIEQIKLAKELEIKRQIKMAEELRLEKIKQEQKAIENNKTYYDFVLTYYAQLSKECGNTLGITASGKQVREGMVASPSIFTFGTQLSIEGRTYAVEDRGGAIRVNSDGSVKLDVFVARLNGESDSQYSRRVMNMGVKRVKGYVINK